MAITLYDLAGAEAERRFSPFCWRTKMALAHKDLEVVTVRARHPPPIRQRPIAQLARLQPARATPPNSRDP